MNFTKKELGEFRKKEKVKDSKEEIVLAYPGYKAIVTYRIANVLYKMNFKLQARMMSEIAHSVGAVFMVDMAHIAGLVAAGLHPNPVPYADVVTTTTHKTLRGPRGGLILCREELAKAINKAIFPGTQGGPLMHTIAAKAVCFGEALKPEFVAYQKQIVANAKALADELVAQGFALVSGGTDNHLMLVDLTPYDLTGKQVEKWLDEAHITANKNTIPNDPQKPFVTSGIRLGTPAATTRGFVEADFEEVAAIIALVLKNPENEEKKAEAVEAAQTAVEEKAAPVEEAVKAAEEAVAPAAAVAEDPKAAAETVVEEKKAEATDALKALVEEKKEEAKEAVEEKKAELEEKAKDAVEDAAKNLLNK